MGGIFFGGIFWRYFLGGFFWEDFFWRIFLGGILWEELLGRFLQGIGFCQDFGVILSQWKEEDFRSLEVRPKLIALKKKIFRLLVKRSSK